MKKTKSFLLATLVSTLAYTGVAAAGPGDTCLQEPQGPEYVLLGQGATYRVEGGSVTDYGKNVNFWNSDGDTGSSKLNLSGTKVKATQKLTFTTRGIGYAYAAPPWLGGNYYCNQIWAHNAPTIAKVSFSSSTRTAVVSYAVDSQFSKAAKTSTPVSVTYSWRSDFYGTTGTMGTQTTNALSGQMSYQFTVPATRDLYHIYAEVSDGKYTQKIKVGGYMQSSGPGGGIIN